CRRRRTSCCCASRAAMARRSATSCARAVSSRATSTRRGCANTCASRWAHPSRTTASFRHSARSVRSWRMVNHIPAERRAQVMRDTAETQIGVTLNVDGTGRAEVMTGIGFYDHMLTAFARHGRFDLTVHAKGDLHIDAHHTMEDVAIAVGQAFDQALGDRAGIVRMADATVPLDEALIQAVVDVSGRPFSAVSLDFVGVMIGEAPAEMVQHVLGSFAQGARVTLHVRQLAGANDHHIAEAVMKALGRAMDMATTLDPRIAGIVPSTKETLSA